MKKAAVLVCKSFFLVVGYYLGLLAWGAYSGVLPNWWNVTLFGGGAMACGLEVFREVLHHME